MPVVNENQDQNHNNKLPRAVYMSLLHEIDAVPEDDLAMINIDVPLAVTNTLGIIPEIEPFAEDAKKLPGFDASCFPKLESYTLALSHAQTVYIAAATPPDDLAALVAQATDGRDLLLGDVRSLGRHGLIAPTRIAEMERGLGHRGVAYDLSGLVEILRENWKAVAGKTAVTEAKLDELETVSYQLLNNVGLRDQAPAIRSEAVARRQKAFTLFLNAHTQVRAAIAFFRRDKGDVDDIIPSLYSGRGNVRRKEQPAPEPAPAPVSPVAHEQEAPAVHVAPGMPGSSPYAQS